MRVLPFANATGGRHYPIQAASAAAPGEAYRASASSAGHNLHAHAQDSTRQADPARPKASLNGLRSPRGGTPPSPQDQSSSSGRSQSNDSSSSIPPSSAPSPPHHLLVASKALTSSKTSAAPVRRSQRTGRSPSRSLLILWPCPQISMGLSSKP